MQPVAIRTVLWPTPTAGRGSALVPEPTTTTGGQVGTTGAVQTRAWLDCVTHALGWLLWPRAGQC